MDQEGEGTEGVALEAQPMDERGGLTEDEEVTMSGEGMLSGEV